MHVLAVIQPHRQQYAALFVLNTGTMRILFRTTGSHQVVHQRITSGHFFAQQDHTQFFSFVLDCLDTPTDGPVSSTNDHTCWLAKALQHPSLSLSLHAPFLSDTVKYMFMKSMRQSHSGTNQCLFESEKRTRRARQARGRVHDRQRGHILHIQSKVWPSPIPTYTLKVQLRSLHCQNRNRHCICVYASLVCRG